MIDKKVEWIEKEETAVGFKNNLFEGMVIDKFRGTAYINGRTYAVDYYLVETVKGCTYIRPHQVNRVVKPKNQLPDEGQQN